MIALPASDAFWICSAWKPVGDSDVHGIHILRPHDVIRARHPGTMAGGQIRRRLWNRIRV